MIKPGVKGDGRMKIERTVVIETSDIQNWLREKGSQKIQVTL